MIRSSPWTVAPLLLALLACKGGSRAEGTAAAPASTTASRADSKAESADRAAGAAVPASSSSKGGTLALTVIEGRSGLEDTGFLHIIGEIRNDTTKWIESPKVAVLLFDAQGKPIGVDSIAAAEGFGESALGMRHNVPPGETSPFHYIRDIKKLARPYASHKLEPRAFPADSSFNATVADVKTDKETIGKTEYWRTTGTVKNAGKPCSNPAAVIAFYDANGKIVDTRSGLTEWDVKKAWPAGASLPFKTGPVENKWGFASSKVWGDCHEPY
ncbi:MAG: hypothetical protein IT377_04030 [Polyangiaceae bacterium]|nr:hypothetical protein [Polyangiaceae bacterium]